MEVVKVDIKKGGSSDTLKIRWSNKDGEFEPYFVDRKVMMRQADEARNELNRLVRKAMKDGVKHIGQNLKSLAEIGTMLYKAVFLGEGKSKHHAQGVQDWLKKLSKPFRIHFVVASRVHIPWGLIYDENIIALEDMDDFNVNQYQNFWCLKYLVSTLYNGINPLADVRIPGYNINLIPLFHKKVYNGSRTLDDSEKDLMDHMFSFFSGSQTPLFTSKDFIMHWKNHAHQNTLLYICSHADSVCHGLNYDDSVSIDDFILKLDKSHDDTSVCISFLNGCSTAVGHEDGGFLEATGKAGFHGFIGTESKIPDIFAIRFGLHFLFSFLCTGKPIYQIMDDLRRKHWPLSIIYSVYCYPSLSVFPTLETIKCPQNFNQENFSLGRIGSNEL